MANDGDAPDGDFTKHPANPLVTRDPDNEYADVHAFDPHPHVVGRSVHLWYTLGGTETADTYGSDMVESVGLATSVDGVNFHTHGENPIIGQQAFGERETLNTSLIIHEDELRLYLRAAIKTEAQDHLSRRKRKSEVSNNEDQKAGGDSDRLRNY